MKSREQRDLFPGALEMMILRTLKRQPLHGYALAQHIKRTSNDLLQIEEGSLYPALQRLLKEELAKAEWSISSTNRRVRIYKLTVKGAKHLEHEVSRFEKMLEGITRFSLTIDAGAALEMVRSRSWRWVDELVGGGGWASKCFPYFDELWRGENSCQDFFARELQSGETWPHCRARRDDCGERRRRSGVCVCPGCGVRQAAACAFSERRD